MAFYGWNEGADWKVTKFMRVLFIIKNELGRPEMADMNYFMIKSAEANIDVAVVCKSGGNEEEHRARGIQVYHSLASGLQWFAHVKKSMQQFNPDIVHVSIHLGCGIYPLLASRSKPKFILDIRSPLLRTGLLRWCVVLKNQIEILGYHRILGHSIASAQTVIGQWHENIVWIPPGVDLSKFQRGYLKKDEAAKPVRFVYIGSLHQIRKVDKMVEAFVMASSRADFLLDIYGSGDIEKELKQLVVSKGLEKTICFKGVLDRDVLFQLLPTYDYGVSYVPKDIFDTAPPLKTMEYLASGIPVLATNTIGNKLFIESNVNGLLTDEGVTTFSNAVCLAVQNSSLFLNMQNIQRTVSRYDWANIVDKQLKPLYLEVL